MIVKKDYEKRIKLLQNKCRENNIDAFLVASSENLYYLTGKSCFPFERPFILIVWKDKPVTYLIPRLESEHMNIIEHISDFKTYYEYPAPEKDCWQNELINNLGDCKHIGVDLYTRSEIYDFVSKKYKVASLDWVYKLRQVKQKNELKLLKQAASYVNSSMKDFISKARYGMNTLETLKPGKKSQQKYFIDNKFDVDYLENNFISAGWSAPNSAKPHSIPKATDRFLAGPHVIILSYRIGGYAIELERTFFTQKPTDKMKEYFQHMRNARDIAFSMIKSGAKCHDIDAATRKYFKENNLLDHVIHRTGHGMGVSNHEGPFLAIGSDTVLEEGMVLTVEPGLYFEGMGAFRHSDTVLVTKDGYESLTDSCDDITSLTVTKKLSLKDRVAQAIIKRMIK